MFNLSNWWCDGLPLDILSLKTEISNGEERGRSCCSGERERVVNEIVAYHGTTRLNWSKIRESGGLSRMTRQHIHMALRLNPENSDDPKRIKITSGFRATSEVALVIDILALLHAKIPIFVSANNVVLSSGTEAGIIPYEYVIKVIDCESGEILTP